MPLFHWLTQHALALLNAFGIIASLLFTGYSLHSEAKTRRVANLIALTQSHRQVWTELFKNQQLNRVLDAEADTATQTVSRDEMIFVNLVIQHLSIVFQAMRDDLTIPPEGLRRDVWWFFSLPVPQAVWEHVKVLQNDAFVAFVEHCRNWK